MTRGMGQYRKTKEKKTFQNKTDDIQTQTLTVSADYK